MKSWVFKWVFLVLLGSILIFPQSVLSSEFRSVTLDSSRVFRDSWFGQDKAKHFLASMLLTGSVTYLAHSKWDRPRNQSQIVGIGFSFSLGLVKEYHDQTRPFGHFSWKDLVFDALGIGMGILCLAWW